MFTEVSSRAKGFFRSLRSSVLTLAFSATPVWAAGGGHGGEHHAASISDLLFPTINFLLFVYLLKWAGGNGIRDYLKQRRQQVLEALEAAAKAKVAAERAHSEVQRKAATVGEESKRLASDILSAAEYERDRRIALAKESAARIKADASLVAEQEALSAQARLRAETVRAAVEETLALLRRQVKAPDQERFMNDFVSSIRARP